MSALRGVVFDLDGTLIDSERLWADAEIALAASHGVVWTEQDAAACFGGTLSRTLQRIIDRGLGIGIEEARERILREMEARYRAHVPWLPGAEALLVELRDAGIPTALGTMCVRRLVDVVVADAPAGTLGHTVAGDEVTLGKPDPEVFLRAMSLLGCTPEEAVIFEDSPIGVGAAVAAGAAVVAFPPDAAGREHLRRHPAVTVLRGTADVDLRLVRRVHSGEVVDGW